MPFFFTPAKETQQPKNKEGQSKKAQNARQRAYYSDPLPFAPPPPLFNVFIPSTYKSLFAPPTNPYVGTWCPATRSVNVCNDTEAVNIWRRGMWGKGTLSRSQP